MAKFSVFAQEFYFVENMRAIENLSGSIDSGRLTEQIAEYFPHHAKTTRERIASKIAQRFFREINGQSPEPFLKLVKSLKSETAKKDLLYWRTARTDKIIAAIAVEIFYPYFALNDIPKGITPDEFQAANTAALFAVDKVITRDFVVSYSRKIWGFDSPRTITLALRIMKDSETIGSINMQIGQKSVPGYFIQPHPLQPEVFAFILFEEFARETPLTTDRIHNSETVKIFFHTRLQADALLRKLEKRRIIVSKHAGRYIAFSDSSQESLVKRLLDQ